MIYASTYVYCLGRELGAEDAAAEFRRQVMQPTEDSLPSARAISRMRGIEDLVMHVDAAATSIGRARARSLWNFRNHPSAPDVWVSIDDDVDATQETLRWLIDGARETRGVIAAPCALRRKEPVVNVIVADGGIVRPVGQGGLMVKCVAAGAGLLAMHRDALEATYQARPELLFRDEDGEIKLGCFAEVVQDGHWWTEDIAFFVKWLPESVRRDILLTGKTTHDGVLLDLAQVPQLPRMAYDAAPFLVT